MRKLDASTITISFDETNKVEDVDVLLSVLNGGKAPAFTAESLAGKVGSALGPFARTSTYMQQPIFNAYHW